MKDYSLLKSLRFERTMQKKKKKKNCPAFHASNSKRANFLSAKHLLFQWKLPLFRCSWFVFKDLRWSDLHVAWIADVFFRRRRVLSLSCFQSAPWSREDLGKQVLGRTGGPTSLHESCLRAVLCYKRLFTKACMCIRVVSLGVLWSTLYAQG